MSATTTLKMVLLGDSSSAERALKGVSGEADKTSSKIHSMHKVGAAAGLALAGGIGLAATAAVDFTKRAIEDQASAQKMATNFKNAAHATDAQVASTEDWITAQGKATGVTDDDLRPALSRLVVATHSVSKAHKLAALSLDISAGSGKSLESVSTALAKAQNGNVGGLARLGIATKDADGKTKSLHDITKDLAATYKGDAAKSADTAAGKQKIMTTQISELKEAIGYKLLPVFEALVDFMVKKALPAISAVGGWVKDHLGPIFHNIGDVISKVTGGMNGDVGKNMAAILDTFHSITSIIHSLWKRFGGFILTYIVNTLKNVWQVIGGAFKIIQGIFKVFSSLLKGDWKGVWVGIKEILSGALTVIKAVLKQALNLIKLLWKVAWSALKAILGAAWDGIKALIKLEITTMIGMFKDIPGAIMKLGGLFVSAGKHLISALFDGFVAAAKGGMGFVADLVGAIKNSINSALHLPLSINFDKGPLHIHSTVIPALAKGGIVNSPTLALIGEAGPEAVVPLSGRNAGGFGGGGGGDINVVVNASGLVDPQAMARQIRTELVKLKRTSFGGPTGSLGLA